MLAEDMIDDFLDGYVTCALWSSTDESTPQGGEPFDKNYSVDDIAPETLDTMRADCIAFLSGRAGEILSACVDMDASEEWSIGRRSEGSILEYAGHDYWLTRNGHGAGFWDGDWPEAYEDELTKLSKDGEFHLYIGDDGLIYGS